MINIGVERYLRKEKKLVVTYIEREGQIEIGIRYVADHFGCTAVVFAM